MNLWWCLLFLHLCQNQRIPDTWPGFERNWRDLACLRCQRAFWSDLSEGGETRSHDWTENNTVSMLMSVALRLSCSPKFSKITMKELKSWLDQKKIKDFTWLKVLRSSLHGCDFDTTQISGLTENLSIRGIWSQRFTLLKPSSDVSTARVKRKILEGQMFAVVQCGPLAVLMRKR